MRCAVREGPYMGHVIIERYEYNGYVIVCTFYLSSFKLVGDIFTCHGWDFSSGIGFLPVTSFLTTHFYAIKRVFN